MKDVAKIPSRKARTLKFGVVSYKDHQTEVNAYLTRIQPLTDEAKAIEFIAGLKADGGGDV